MGETGSTHDYALMKRLNVLTDKKAARFPLHDASTVSDSVSIGFVSVQKSRSSWGHPYS